MAEQAASEAGRNAEAQQSASIEPSAPESDGESDNKEPLVRVEPRNNPRNEMMEELIASRNAEPQDTPQPDNTQPKQAETTPEAPAIEAAPEAPKTVRVKVDGEEFDVPEAEIEEAGGVKAYQKDRVAENRLRKSNEALAEVRRGQAQLAAWLQQQQAPKVPQQTPEAFIMEKVDVIRYGSPEESAAALREVMERNNPRVDSNAIVGQAVSVMQQQAAEQQFVQEFADLVHTPLVLKTIIREKDERIADAAKNGNRIADWPTFYRSLGNEMRSAFSKPNQLATAQKESSLTTGSTSQALSDKEARKASITNLPTAAARAAMPESDKPETREDVLSQMRKSRGIPH